MTAATEYERRLIVPSDIQEHLVFMHDTVAGYAKPVVIELGVRSGNSTSALLSAVTETAGTLWSCDIEKPDVPADWWQDPLWWFVQADDLSAKALRILPPKCDVLFVDADHSFEHVLAELNAYMPRVKPGGVALFHDTQWDCVDDLDIDLQQPVGPVAQALTRYCRARRLEWFNRPGSYGMGVIRL